MNKILITTSSFNLQNFPAHRELEEAGYEIVTNPFGRRLTEADISELLTGDVVGMIAGVEPLTGKVLSSAKRLKVIARCGIGLDSVDLEAAAELGIEVSNTPDAPTVPVAELTLAHMLNLLRGVATADRKIRQGQWTPVMGELLAVKTVGILGLGRIGRKVAELVRAFGASVIAYDSADIRDVTGVVAMSLNDVMAKSDIVSLHIPYSPENRHIVGESEIRLMKPSAYLVNISRGGLVDEKALYDALSEKRIAGAGLDTYEEEPYSGPLCDLSNVLLTAHMGSYAKEARTRQEREASINLVAAMKKLKLLD